jgi:hypothetical protein
MAAFGYARRVPVNKITLSAIVSPGLNARGIAVMGMTVPDAWIICTAMVCVSALMMYFVRPKG